MTDRTHPSRNTRELWGRALREGGADGERIAKEATRDGLLDDPFALEAFQNDLHHGPLHAAALGRGRDLARLAGLDLDESGDPDQQQGIQAQREMRETYARDYAHAVWGCFISYSLDLIRAARIARAEARELAVTAAAAFGLSHGEDDHGWLN